MKLTTAAALGVLACLPLEMVASAAGDAPLAIPTFHCLGIYWSPPGTHDRVSFNSPRAVGTVNSSRV